MILLRLATSLLRCRSRLPESEPSSELRPPSRNFSFQTYTVRGARLCSLQSSATRVSGLNIRVTMRTFSSGVNLVLLSVTPWPASVVKVCIVDRSPSSGAPTRTMCGLRHTAIH